MVVARWNVMTSRTSSGTSSRSGRCAREDHLGQPGPVCGQHLLLDPADGQHPALQGDLAGHADHERTGMSRSRLTSAVVMVTPADGPSLGTAPAGTCTWKRLPAKIRVDPELVGVRAHVGERDLGRLLHDVTELTGEGQAFGPVGHAGLDEEHVAAGSGDGQAGDHTGHAGPIGRLEEEVGPTQATPHVGASTTTGASRSPAASLVATLRSKPAELTLERAHARFPGVVGHDAPQRVVADLRPRPRAARPG
jgi:hypothetical protein